MQENQIISYQQRYYTKYAFRRQLFSSVDAKNLALVGLAQVSPVLKPTSPVLKPTKNSHPKENASAKEREKGRGFLLPLSFAEVVLVRGRDLGKSRRLLIGWLL